MCEFRVILDGEEVFKDVVYVKAEDGRVLVRDVVGESIIFENCRIVEVDVNNTRLVLSRA
ncbi:MAG: CooT family nickel-binding protein [Candidatus Bathyarchaeia archaeon]|nr:CooT family nickel-binding protein [Candidatus Bathyarchaeota archaeon]